MLRISIPTPCHEDWDKMSPRDQGAFCSVCSKTVVDFTKLSDEQVKNYFLDNAGKKTCGRFRKEQLTDEEDFLPRIFSGDIPLWKKFLAAVVILFAGLLTGCNEATKGRIAVEEKTSITLGEPSTDRGPIEPEIPSPEDSLLKTESLTVVGMLGIEDGFVPPPVLLGDIVIGEPVVETLTGAPVVIIPDTTVTGIIIDPVPSTKDSINKPVKKDCGPGKDSLIYLKPE